MREFRVGTAIAFACVLLLSCKDRSTGPDNRAVVTFRSESSGCLSKVTPSTGAVDSSFAYSFHDSLLIDFSVTANCCPDSGRFNISQFAGSDTVVITVTDTAVNGCRCVCPYMIHAVFEHLPNDRYAVRCRICNSGGCSDPIYLVNVRRSP